MARLLEKELTAELETLVTLNFDDHTLDIAGRVQSFKDLTAGGLELKRLLP